MNAQRLAAMLAVAVVSGTVQAQDVPETVRDASATQMSQLLERAGNQDKIVKDLRARLSGSRIVFDATFSENEQNVQWLVQLNLSDAQLSSFAAECEPKGYERTIETSVRIRAQKLNSVVWVKPERKPEPLVLPTGALPESGIEDNRLRSLDELMRSFMAEHNVAGGTLAVAIDQRLIYSRGFGYADVESQTAMRPDSELRIASVSKSLTGVAMMMLVERGLVKLDDRVLPLLQRGRYPKLKRDADVRWNDITIRHLLQHSGGWDRDTSGDPMFAVVTVTREFKLRKTATVDDIIRYQLTQSLDFAPGEKYCYSNFGYAVLGRILEIVMQKSYRDCIDDLILTPRKMKHTRPGLTRLADRGKNEATYYMQNSQRHAPFWSVLAKARRGSLDVPESVLEPYGRWDLEVMDAHGGWVSTAPDLLRLVTGLTDPQEPLLTEESIAQMTAMPQLEKPGSGRLWYGCGWNVRRARSDGETLDRHSIWHSGALAGTSSLLVRRADGISWAVLFNTDFSPNEQRLTLLLDGLIHRAVDAVEFWPDYDLFSEL